MIYIIIGIVILVLLGVYLWIRNIDVYYLNYKRIFMAYKTALNAKSDSSMIDKFKMTATIYFSYTKADDYIKVNMSNTVMSIFEGKELFDEKKALIELANMIMTTEETYLYERKQRRDFDYEMALATKKQKALEKAIKNTLGNHNFVTPS